jgi:hypothetical protein
VRVGARPQAHSGAQLCYLLTPDCTEVGDSHGACRGPLGARTARRLRIYGFTDLPPSLPLSSTAPRRQPSANQVTAGRSRWSRTRHSAGWYGVGSLRFSVTLTPPAFPFVKGGTWISLAHANTQWSIRPALAPVAVCSLSCVTGDATVRSPASEVECRDGALWQRVAWQPVRRLPFTSRSQLTPTGASTHWHRSSACPARPRARRPHSRRTRQHRASAWRGGRALWDRALGRCASVSEQADQHTRARSSNRRWPARLHTTCIRTKRGLYSPQNASLRTARAHAE